MRVRRMQIADELAYLGYDLRIAVSEGRTESARYLAWRIRQLRRDAQALETVPQIGPEIGSRNSRDDRVQSDCPDSNPPDSNKDGPNAGINSGDARAPP